MRLSLAATAETRRDFGSLVATVALAVAFVIMCIMVRAFSHAMWLSIPLVAAGVLHLASMLRLRGVLARVLVAIVLSPTATSAMAYAAARAAAGQPVEPADSRLPCLRSENFAPLAQLAPGLVATDIDQGPFILALTPHAVLSAPYHLLGAPIIAAHLIFALPPGTVKTIVAKTGANYLVTCERHTLGGIDGAERAASLWGRLQVGEVPDWLQPLPRGPEEPLSIYRVRF